MGVVYGMGEDVDDETVGLRQRIQQESREDGRPVYTPLVGLALILDNYRIDRLEASVRELEREQREMRADA